VNLGYLIISLAQRHRRYGARTAPQVQLRQVQSPLGGVMTGSTSGLLQFMVASSCRGLWLPAS